MLSRRTGLSARVVTRSTFRTISPDSASIRPPYWIIPIRAPGRNSTSRSTSLSGRTCPRATEPKTESRLTWYQRQISRSFRRYSVWSIGPFMLYSHHPPTYRSNCYLRSIQRRGTLSPGSTGFWEQPDKTEGNVVRNQSKRPGVDLPSFDLWGMGPIDEPERSRVEHGVVRLSGRVSPLEPGRGAP